MISLPPILLPLCLWLNCEVPILDVQDYLSPPAVVEQVEPEPEPIAQAAIPQAMAHKPGTDVSEWLPLVAGHFEPGDVARALCLMSWESQGDPSAKNPKSGASGLMQIMPFWAAEYDLAASDLLIPEINLYVARKIKDTPGQGWGAWAPYNRGECR